GAGAGHPVHQRPGADRGARHRPDLGRVLRGGAADRRDGLRQHRGGGQVPAAWRHHRLTGEVPMSLALELLVCFFLLLGSGFTLIGAIGLYRLPDFFTRLHGPTKATTLGVGSLLIASMIYFA